MRKYSFFFTLVVTTFLSGCLNLFRSSPTVIQVNERNVKAKEFATELLDRFRGLDPVSLNNPEYLKIVKNQVVQDMILKMLIDDFAEEQSVSVSAEEVQSEIQKSMQDYPDELAFRQNLIENGLSYESWKRNLQDNLIRKKVTARIESTISSPTEEELMAEYNRTQDRYQRPNSVFLKQIVLRDESAADLLHESLKKNKLSFEEAAKKYSISPEGQTGGEVGWIFENEIEIFKPAFALPLNRMSEIHKSPVGFHIFLVTEKKKAGLADFNDVKHQIASSLVEKRKQAKFSEWLDLRLRISRVSINEELVKSMIVEVRDQL